MIPNIQYFASLHFWLGLKLKHLGICKYCGYTFFQKRTFQLFFKKKGIASPKLIVDRYIGLLLQIL